MNLLELAKAVKRGVKVLDKKVPSWRTVLRKHQDQYDFKSGSHCVLGTLEHFSGRMQVLKAKRKLNTCSYGFIVAHKALGLSYDDVYTHGFERSSSDISSEQRTQDRETLDALWRAEFER